MLTTYYQTSDPGKLEQSEYFQLYIRAEEKDGEVIYFLDENHGWFREGKRAIDNRTIFTEGYPTFAEAEALLKDQVRSLVNIGYVTYLRGILWRKTGSITNRSTRVNSDPHGGWREFDHG